MDATHGKNEDSFVPLFGDLNRKVGADESAAIAGKSHQMEQGQAGQSTKSGEGREPIDVPEGVARKGTCGICGVRMSNGLATCESCMEFFCDTMPETVSDNL